jgi:hypothetical protein
MGMPILRMQAMSPHYEGKRTFGHQALALRRAFDTAATNAEDLTAATIEDPDAEIISLPGLGSLTGRRGFGWLATGCSSVPLMRRPSLH